MQPTTIDPFGLWPTSRSVIAGLRAGEPHPKSNYAFHTAYRYLGGVEATFRIRLDGVKASAGRLRIRLQSIRGDEPARLVKEHRFALTPSSPDVLDVEFRFAPVPDVAYAIRGVVDRGRAVAARTVTVELDEADDARAFHRALVGARTDLFAAPSTARAGKWPFRATVERRGLVQREPATLAAPVSQMCTAAQFGEPEYRRWIDAMRWSATRHRKQWEFVYILAALDRHGMLAPGRRGLGFGTGTEPLPALMASLGCLVTATDMPADDQTAGGWAATGQHADGPESVWRPDLVDRATFERNVSFRAVDMNAVPADLVKYDFCWSACAYEHVGSIAAGLRFVERSIETLRPGGVAVHTTELNLTSNGATVDNQNTVLFRKRDFEALALRLAGQGHRVLPLCWDQGTDPVDEHIDMPPYRNDPHLKLALASFVTTSFGMVVIRGR